MWPATLTRYSLAMLSRALLPPCRPCWSFDVGTADGDGRLDLSSVAGAVAGVQQPARPWKGRLLVEVGFCHQPGCRCWMATMRRSEICLSSPSQHTSHLAKHLPRGARWWPDPRVESGGSGCEVTSLRSPLVTAMDLFLFLASTSVYAS